MEKLMALTPGGRIAEKDWDSLLPSKVHMLAGKLPVRLEPAGIHKMELLSSKILVVTAVLEAAEITWESLEDKQKLAAALPLIIQAIPEVLAELSGIHIDDLARLPLEVLVPLCYDVIEVNMASLDYLQKNLQSLAMTLVAIRNMALRT